MTVAVCSAQANRIRAREQTLFKVILACAWTPYAGRLLPGMQALCPSARTAGCLAGDLAGSSLMADPPGSRSGGTARHRSLSPGAGFGSMQAAGSRAPAGFPQPLQSVQDSSSARPEPIVKRYGGEHARCARSSRADTDRAAQFRRGRPCNAGAAGRPENECSLAAIDDLTIGFEWPKEVHGRIAACAQDTGR